MASTHHQLKRIEEPFSALRTLLSFSPGRFSESVAKNPAFIQSMFKELMDSYDDLAAEVDKRTNQEESTEIDDQLDDEELVEEILVKNASASKLKTRDNRLPGRRDVSMTLTELLEIRPDTSQKTIDRLAGTRSKGRVRISEDERAVLMDIRAGKTKK